LERLGQRKERKGDLLRPRDLDEPGRFSEETLPRREAERGKKEKRWRANHASNENVIWFFKRKKGKNGEKKFFMRKKWK